MKELRNYSKYFLLAFIIIISYLSFVIVRPYLLAVLGAIILSYIFNPLYQGLLKKIRNRNVCALLMLFIVLLLILLPLFFTFQVLLQQLLTFSEGGRGEIIDKLTQQSLHPKIVEYIFQALDFGIEFLKDLGSQIFVSLPSFLISFFVLVFSFFYMLRDGDKIMKTIEELIPLKKEYKERFLKEFKEITHSTVYGLLVAGFIQGVLGTLAFLLFGLSNPLVWGFVIMVLAILPLLGPILVWGPASIYLFAINEPTKGFLLLLYGGAMALLESIMRPKLISGKSKLHPILVVLGLVGGLRVFGITGVILGPFILSFLIILLKGYAFGTLEEETEEVQEKKMLYQVLKERFLKKKN